MQSLHIRSSLFANTEMKFANMQTGELTFLGSEGSHALARQTRLRFASAHLFFSFFSQGKLEWPGEYVQQNCVLKCYPPTSPSTALLYVWPVA